MKAEMLSVIGLDRIFVLEVDSFNERKGNHYTPFCKG